MSEFYLFDIGSRGNVSARWHEVADEIHVVGFEPDEAECESLNNAAVRTPFLSEHHYPIALSYMDGPMEFYITRSPACSGFYRPIKETFSQYMGDPDRSDILESKSIFARSLTSFCAERLVQPSFIKLDAQGSEFDILRTFDGLENVLGVEIELQVLPLYRGDVTNFTRPQEFLQEAGFLPWWFRPQYWESVSGGLKRIAWFDALYINEKLLSHRHMDIILRAYADKVLS